jgi:CBS domain-containing protein
MTSNVIKVKPDTGLRQIARIMSKERIHRVMVMERGRVVGLVSSMDVLKALAKDQPKPARPRR